MPGVTCIEGDRPPTACIGNVLAADADAVAGVVAEILDNDSRTFVAAAGIDTHPAAHRNVGRRGRIGHRVDIFIFSAMHRGPLHELTFTKNVAFIANAGPPPGRGGREFIFKNSIPRIGCSVSGSFPPHYSVTWANL
jgi:hypothetical protein